MLGFDTVGNVEPRAALAGHALSNRALLVTYLKPQWPRVLLLAALLFSAIGLQLAIPQLVRHFIDLAQAGESLQTLATVALVFLSVALLGQVVGVAETYVAEDLGWLATNALRSDLVRHTLNLDMFFHTAHTPGGMIERIDGDVTSLANFFSEFVLRVLGSGLLLVGVLILLFREDWRVGLVLTAFATMAFAILTRRTDVVSPYWQASRESSASLFGFLEERLSGLADIRSNGAQAYVMHRLYERLRDRFTTARSALIAGSIFYAAVDGLFAIGTGLALMLGVALYQAGALTLGTVYLVFQYTRMLRHPLEQINRQMQDLQRASASLVRIRELLDTPATILDGSGAALPDGPLSVEFRNVSFAYFEHEPVLRDLSFRLRPGEVLGLLGRTGSGKTSLARLLTRLYDPSDGGIMLGEVDIRHLHLDELRSRIGLVTQDVQLFAGTVRDNLTLFDPGVSDERIVQVLDDLGLRDWRVALPAGLDTAIPASGSGLSAGEAQLLAVTRVFLRDPGLVILDEASSRLDPASEQRMERAMEKLLNGRTAIVIAHRLATVDRADAIMILEDGCIQEYGRREQLARDPNSRFSLLLRTGLGEVLA